MKYNEILVDFNFLVDLDLAMFKFIKTEYNNPKFVDQKIISLQDEKEIIKLLLYRDSVNVLEALIPKENTLEMYKDIMNNKMDSLLKYAKASDIFGLMITFLREGSSVDVTVLCESKLQADFIHSLNPILKTTVSSRKNIALSKYNVIYSKFYSDILKYNKVAGKNIYIANAKYNMEPGKNIPNMAISTLVGDINIIRTIDLYRNIKYRKED